MDKSTLCKECGFNSLPKSLDVSFDEVTGVLRLHLNDKSVCDNMQTNNSAFEGWMFCILSKLKCGNWKYAELDWSVPDNIDNGHYNRFLYRVIKMQQHYKWFRIPTDKQKIIDNFKKEYLDSNILVLNTPNNEAADVNNVKSESYFESVFYHDKILLNDYNLSVVNRQLPVGVFKEKVSSHSYLFTGGKSAIDLWGINDSELYIFELKFKNKMVGIITETLFYQWIIEDVIFNKHIRLGEKTPKREYNKLHEAISNNKIKKIIAVFLIDEIHPQIDNAVISLINDLDASPYLEVQMRKYQEHTTVKLV